MNFYVNGKQASKGMKVETFRGEAATLISWHEPYTPTGGKGGRVYIKFDTGETGEYFPSVIGGIFAE